ncbi:hypothetical protein [Planococcus sp. YIM B11945]|uniref:hypothetical protein n=1 Tax=Planococcus sp. YIM B11945 TaxID=3435410 RepID=UPI003D7D56AA
MTLIEKEFYTEREAIELLMLYSYSDGSEFETAVWKERGALKKNSSTHKAVLRKLNCLFDNVSCEGKESVRKYFLTGLKDQPIKDMGGNIGRRATSKDFLMDEYIFNKLVELKDNSANAYGAWIRELKILESHNFYSKKIVNMIGKLHEETPGLFNASEIRDEFIHTITKRNLDIVENAFQRLEKDKRIELKVFYNFKKIDGSNKLVSKQEYDEVSEEFTSFLKKEETSYHRFNKIRNKKRPSEREIEILESAKKQLAHFDIEYYYKSYQVKIVDETIRQDMNKEEFEKVYFDRLLELTEYRQEKYLGKQTEYFWQKYYKLNTLAILRHIGVEGLDNEIEIELNKRPIAFGHNVDLSEIF